MAGSPSAAWLKAMRAAAVEPVVHCSIALDGATMDFHNSPESLDSSVTGDPLLSTLTAVAQSVDPIRRGLQLSELDLTLVDDGKIRGLVASQNFYNAVTTVKLGSTGLALSDFEIIFKGNVVRLHPLEGQITIKLRSLDSLIADKSNMRAYINKHPFDVVEQMLLDSGVASGNIDSTSFTLGTYSADISHYCFSSVAAMRTQGSEDFDTRGRGGDPGITYMVDYNYDSIDFRTFVDEVMMLTRTTMFVDSAGKVALKHFNSSEATVKHFTTDEYTDFQQVEEDPAIYNKVNASFRSSGPQRFVRSDATSVTAYGDEQLDIDVLFLAPNAVYHESGSVITAEPTVSGYAGTVSLTSSQSDEAPSADRPVYWMHRQEVLKSTSAFTLNSQSIAQNFGADGDAAGGVTTIPTDIRLNSPASRPFAGNQSTEADRFVYDLTATFDFTSYVLARFSNTAPKVRITTSLEFAYLELGDLVSLDNDLFLSPELALDGLDSSVKFEIVGKEVTALGDSVGVVFDLFYATKTSPPSTSLAAQLADKYDTMMPDSILQAIDIGLSANSVANGLDLSTGSGLVGVIAAGAASGGGGVLRTNPGNLNFTATASKDNYVGINLFTGEPIVTAVTTGAAEPALLSGEVRLGKAVAGSSSISSVSDLRRIGHVSVEQVDKQAIAPGAILLWNPGFDIWPDTGLPPSGWELTSGVIPTDLRRGGTTTHSGRYGVRTVDTATAATLTSAKIPINKNKPYRAAAWVYLDSSHEITLTILWWKADRTASSTASTEVYSADPTDSEWVNISGVASPPADAAYASVRISREASPGDEGHWDDISLTEEPVSFSVYGAATTAPGTKSVFQVKYNNENHDYGGNYDHSGSDYDFEAPSAGTYEFSAAVQGVYVGAFTYLTLMIYKNGSVLRESYGGDRAVGTKEAFATVETGPVELAKGDLITVQMHPEIQTSYTLNTGASETYFSGRKIS